MPPFNFVDSFTEDLAEGLHDFENDTLEVALCNAANAPVTGNSELADLTEIAYTNLSARTLTTTSSSQTSGNYSLVLDDLTINCTGGAAAAFQYIVIFNQSSTGDRLLGWYDRGSELTMNDGDSFSINFDGDFLNIS